MHSPLAYTDRISVKKVVRNTVFNLLRGGIVVPVYFFITPFTIAKIGVAGYGLWSLTGTLASYQTFVNMGLTSAIVRYVARERAREDVHAVSEYLAVALVIFTVLPSIVVLCISLLRGFVAVHILGVTTDIGAAEFLIVTSALCAMINMILGLFKATLDGSQRMDISNSIVSAQVIVSAIGTVYFLERGYGVRGLGINLIVTTLFSLVLNVYFSLRTNPGMRINPFLFRWARLKEMFSYSVNLQLGAIARAWVEPLNKIIIAHMFSVSYVSFYDISLKIVGQLSNLINSALQSIFPASAEVFERHGHERVELLRRKSLQYVLPMVAMVYIAIFVVIGAFVNIWLGTQLTIVATIVRIFLVAYFAMALTTPAWVILNALGYSKDILFMDLKVVAINVVGIMVLGLLFGYYGFCTGFAISQIVGFFLTQQRYNYRFRSVDVSTSELLDPKVWGIALAMLALGLAVLVIIPLNNYAAIALFSIAFCMIYAVTLWKTRIFGRENLHEILGASIYDKVFGWL